MKGEQGRYGSDDILMKLRKDSYSAAWFFEQWSVNRQNALIAFKQLSDNYMGLLIANLDEYLRSQYFFELSNKSKIKGCIETLWKERRIEKNKKRKMIEEQALNKMELQREIRTDASEQLDGSPSFLEQQLNSFQKVKQNALSPVLEQRLLAPVMDQTGLSPGFNSQLHSQHYLSSNTAIGVKQRSDLRQNEQWMKTDKNKKAQAINCMQRSLKCNHQINQNQEEEEETNEETDFLIKKCL